MSHAPSADVEPDWPVWSGRDPAELARYVVPEVVGLHARVPGVSAGPIRRRLELTWDRLRAARIGYAFERFATGVGGQWIRSPSELLVAPSTGTCLDLAVLLAGACLHAGIPSAIVVLDGVEPAPRATRWSRSWKGTRGRGRGREP